MSYTDMPAGSSSNSEPAGSIDLDRLRSIRTGTAVAAIVVVAAMLRLWELGERAMHHDESLDAWWSWRFRNGDYDHYDPVYHGPLRFYITAGFYEIFGESSGVARLFSALTGAAAVGLPWFLRRELGRAATIASATALCISPTMLYYSRFGREDAQMVFLTLAAIVLGLAYLRRPRVSTATILAFVLACSFAIKESTYLFGLLLAVYLVVVVAAQFDSQTRVDAGRCSDSDQLDPAFFSAALALASIGLLVAVIVGAASDELFPALILYIGGLTTLAFASAMPRLRRAGTRWTFADAAAALVGAAVIGQMLRVWRAAPGTSWQISIPAVAVMVILVALIAALAALPRMQMLAQAGTWTIAFTLGAAGLLAQEWIERTLAARELPVEGMANWQVSPPALVVGAVLALVGLAWRFGPDVGLIHPPTWQPTSATATGVGIVGAALIINEYTESESNRLIVGVVTALFIAAVLLVVGSLPSTRDDFVWPALLRSIGAIGWRGWALPGAVFAVSWWCFFTVWGSVKADWASGFTRAIQYWDSQQEVNRGGQPWHYYLFALPAYEWLFLALAIIGIAKTLRRPTIMTGLFVWFAIGSLILYSYAGERMPWLTTHPLLPVLILAGVGVGWLVSHRGHDLMAVVATACAVGLALTTVTSVRASFPNGTDARELLSQAGQATPHVTSALDRLDNINRLSLQTTGEPATLAIGTENAWPWSWYLRDRPNVMWFNNVDGPPDDDTIDVIIVDHDLIALDDFPEFQATIFAMRSWWVPTYTEGGVTGWLAWARDRSLWSQGPNSSFVGVRTIEPDEVDTGIGARIDRMRAGVDDASRGFVEFVGADRDLVIDPIDADSGANDGRDGCGSVDQWFMVHNVLAALEQQLYPEPIEAMGPLDCASDLLATS